MKKNDYEKYRTNNSVYNPNSIDNDFLNLYSPKKFGAHNSYQCSCGKFKRIRYKNIVCDICGTKVTSSDVGYEIFGTINLEIKIIHPLYFDKIINLLNIDLNKEQYNSIIQQIKNFNINDNIIGRKQRDIVDYFKKNDIQNLNELLIDTIMIQPVNYRNNYPFEKKDKFLIANIINLSQSNNMLSLFKDSKEINILYSEIIKINHRYIESKAKESIFLDTLYFKKLQENSNKLFEKYKEMFFSEFPIELKNYNIEVEYKSSMQKHKFDIDYTNKKESDDYNENQKFVFHEITKIYKLMGFDLRISSFNDQNYSNVLFDDNEKMEKILINDYKILANSKDEDKYTCILEGEKHTVNDIRKVKFFSDEKEYCVYVNKLPIYNQIIFLANNGTKIDINEKLADDIIDIPQKWITYKKYDEYYEKLIEEEEKIKEELKNFKKIEELEEFKEINKRVSEKFEIREDFLCDNSVSENDVQFTEEFKEKYEKYQWLDKKDYLKISCNDENWKLLKIDKFLINTDDYKKFSKEIRQDKKFLYVFKKEFFNYHYIALENGINDVIFYKMNIVDNIENVRVSKNIYELLECEKYGITNFFDIIFDEKNRDDFYYDKYLDIKFNGITLSDQINKVSMSSDASFYLEIAGCNYFKDVINLNEDRIYEICHNKKRVSNEIISYVKKLQEIFK